MSAGAYGDFTKLQKKAEALRRLPKVVAIRAAAMSAGAINALAAGTFSRSEDAYGVGWKPSVDGEKVTLRKSGKLASNVRYKATGTRLRAVLGVAYAKYQVGARPIFPRKGDLLPKEYTVALKETCDAVVREELSK